MQRDHRGHCCRCQVRRHCGVVVDCVVRRCLLVGHENARSVLCGIRGCLEIEKCKEIIVVIVFVGSGCCCRWQVRRRCGIVVDCAVRRCLSVGHESAHSVLCAIGGCWEIEKCKEIIVGIVVVVRFVVVVVLSVLRCAG